MKRRLYLLTPDAVSARRLVDELLLARVDAAHIHVLARDDIALADLPEASLLQKSDVIHGIGSGLVAGGATGVIAGAVAALIPAPGVFGTGGIILACAIAGAFMGAWAAGMIGTDVRNRQLRSFESALERGEVLLMVDVPKERVDEISALVQTGHRAHLEGTEPTIPAFP